MYSTTNGLPPSYSQGLCGSPIQSRPCDEPEAKRLPVIPILEDTQKMLGDLLDRLLMLDGHVNGSRPQPGNATGEASRAGSLIELASQIRSSVQAAGLLSDRIRDGLSG